MAEATRKVRRVRRHTRARKKIKGTNERPRLVVYRSNKHITAQIVNDIEGKTLCEVGSYSKEFKGESVKGSAISGAETVGKAIAEKAKANGIEKIVYDCGGNLYHGRVKALAEAARKAGLDF